MLILKVLSIALHLLLLGGIVQQLRHPYRFAQWQRAWGMLAVGVLLMTWRRIYVFWWLQPDMLDVVASIVASLCLLVGFWSLAQIFEGNLTLAHPTDAARIEIDEFSTITAWDAQAEHLFGWTSWEAVGQTLMQTIIPPRDWEAHRNGVARLIAAGDPGRTLLRNFAVNARRKDGQEIAITITVSSLLTASGERRFQGLARELGVL